MSHGDQFQAPPAPNGTSPLWEAVIEDMRARDGLGLARYGVRLQAFNGRNSLLDLYQELLDAAVYAKQALVERAEKDAVLEGEGADQATVIRQALRGLCLLQGMMMAKAGFHDVPCTLRDRLLLIHTEVSEATEAVRDPTMSLMESTVRADGKPEGLPSELADIVLRVADLCYVHGIDLGEAVTLKMAYNATRAKRHGGKTF